MFSWFKVLWFRLFGWKTEILLDLIDRIQALEEDNEAMKLELGQIAVYCDKCSGRIAGCLKCGGRGIITKSQLMSWKW